jgi:hypothetical protein
LIAAYLFASIEQVASTIRRGFQISAGNPLIEGAQDRVRADSLEPDLIGLPAIDIQRLQPSADLTSDDCQTAGGSVKPLTDLPGGRATLLVDSPSLQGWTLTSISSDGKYIDPRLVAAQRTLVER